VTTQPLPISVVIPTYQRPEECRRAVGSVLRQTARPLEVLVVDNGSRDGSGDELERLAAEDPVTRYLRVEENSGGPAPARNLGLKEARGEWIALLDDDDEWAPEKLAVQSSYMAGDRYDVVASNARRLSGGAYLPATDTREPAREEFLEHNPIITSSAVARRSLLLAAGGFPASVAGVTGIDDYAVWLALAYSGARFVVLGDPLVFYTDVGEERASRAVVQQGRGVAAVRWRLWLRRPTDSAVLRASLRASADAARHQVRSWFSPSPG
jgi:teichuronic acid biosynthesis glycosyltransferase TuaG